MAIFRGRLLDVYKHSTLMMMMKMMMTKMSRILMMIRMTMIIIITSGTGLQKAKYYIITYNVFSGFKTLIQRALVKSIKL